jgi:hypothetical protein
MQHSGHANTCKSRNQFRCSGCGRHFNSGDELRIHEQTCLAAKGTGSGSTERNQGQREEGEDRDWVSTP